MGFSFGWIVSQTRRSSCCQNHAPVLESTVQAPRVPRTSRNAPFLTGNGPWAGLLSRLSSSVSRTLPSRPAGRSDAPRQRRSYCTRPRSGMKTRNVRSVGRRIGIGERAERSGWANAGGDLQSRGQGRRSPSRPGRHREASAVRGGEPRRSRPPGRARQAGRAVHSASVAQSYPGEMVPPHGHESAMIRLRVRHDRRFGPRPGGCRKFLRCPAWMRILDGKHQKVHGDRHGHYVARKRRRARASQTATMIVGSMK